MPFILRFKKKKKKEYTHWFFINLTKFIYLEKLLAIFRVQLCGIYSFHMNNKSHHKFKKKEQLLCENKEFQNTVLHYS